MTESPEELLLFDLGGVLVEYTGTSDIHALLSERLAPERFRQLFQSTADVWAAFESGLLTPEAFVARFAQHWPLAVTHERFLREFETWTRGLLPGAAETLDALRPKFRLAALSNSNVLHWRRNALLGIPALFERAFASHELGMRKPAPEVYEYVLKELGAGPGQSTFFDDQEPNVEAARRLGMRAYRVEGVAELRACLRELGYLDGRLP